MWFELEKDLRAEANRQIRDFERYRRHVHDENSRRSRRSTSGPKLLEVQRPGAWTVDRGFDPYHVRSRASTIAHAVTQALKTGTYSPHPPASFDILKSNGEMRTVCTFACVDSVVSARLYRNLLARNRPLLSARSYAYRSDLGPHDAIMHIKSEWRREQRVFVAEFDFTKFFDRISHDYIWETVEALGFMMTPLERKVLKAFISTPEPAPPGSTPTSSPGRRTVGVPQGTSISLLVANLVATPLDRALERLGVGFVRYADDTLIWSRSYSAVCEAVEQLHVAARLIGSDINFEKSEGVRLLVPKRTVKAEIRHTASIEFLGHEIGLGAVGMKPAVEEKVRDRVSKLLFDNLLREPLAGTQAIGRLTNTDRDYATFVWQLRRYFYGPLSEAQLRRFHEGSVPRIRFQGIMSFFPLLDQDATLAALDSWITTQAWLTLRKRSFLLSKYVQTTPEPWHRKRRDLSDLIVPSTSSGRMVDLRLPSLLRVSRVIGRAVHLHGTAVVGRGSGLYLYEG